MTSGILNDFLKLLFSTDQNGVVQFGSQFIVELIALLIIFEFIRMTFDFVKGGWK